MAVNYLYLEIMTNFRSTFRRILLENYEEFQEEKQRSFGIPNDEKLRNSYEIPIFFFQNSYIYSFFLYFLKIISGVRLD